MQMIVSERLCIVSIVSDSRTSSSDVLFSAQVCMLGNYSIDRCLIFAMRNMSNLNFKSRKGQRASLSRLYARF